MCYIYTYTHTLVFMSGVYCGQIAATAMGCYGFAIIRNEQKWDGNMDNNFYVWVDMSVKPSNVFRQTDARKYA